MRVPALLVAPAFRLFTGVLGAQSTNASLTGRVTDLSKATGEAKVTKMNAGTSFHDEAATSSSGVPRALARGTLPEGLIERSIEARSYGGTT
jgi:hypothetical protein